jgi:transitional endoplasmic reticulum ATPase
VIIQSHCNSGKRFFILMRNSREGLFLPDAICEMILLHITGHLSEDSLLMKILVKNNANQLPFWQDISSKMNVFSNTMIIDFTQSLKKRIRNAYLKDHSEQIKIDSNILNAALRDASAKLTAEYLDQVNQFIIDVTLNNYEDFTLRIEDLKKELDHYKTVEAPRQSIGFSHNEEESKK